MDRKQYAQKRRGRYLAQTLEAFENDIEPLVPQDVASTFKALVRRKFGALTTDCIEVMELEGQAMNGYARDIKDRLHPDAAPARENERSS